MFSRAFYLYILFCVSFWRGVWAMENPRSSSDQAVLNSYLVLSATNNYIDCVRRSLQLQADVNTRMNSHGNLKTPLLAACSFIPRGTPKEIMRQEDTRTQLVALLFQHNADPNIPDDNGLTPLHAIARFKSIPVLELLKKAGADVNVICTNLHCTPCHNAVEHNALETIAWLDEAGADMNVIDTIGMAPIHMAIYIGGLQTVEQLLLHGAKLDIITHKNKVPDAPETQVPVGSTVFHLTADYPEKDSLALQRLLLYHGLYHPKEKPLRHSAIIAFLCHLKKECPSLYTNRFDVLMPYLAQHVSPETLIHLLSCKTGKAHAFAYRILEKRMQFMQSIVATKDCNGNIAYMLECRDKIRRRNSCADTLLLSGIYDDHLIELSTAVQKKGFCAIEGLPETNIFKAAYLIIEPSKQSWRSWLQEKAKEFYFGK